MGMDFVSEHLFQDFLKITQLLSNFRECVIVHLLKNHGALDYFLTKRACLMNMVSCMKLNPYIKILRGEPFIMPIIVLITKCLSWMKERLKIFRSLLNILKK